MPRAAHRRPYSHQVPSLGCIASAASEFASAVDLLAASATHVANT